MRRWVFSFALAAAAISMTGCGQGISSAGPSYGVSPATDKAAFKASWMLPDASTRKALLYVSDADDSVVDVYDYANGKQVGMLLGTGSSRPGAQCVDRTGNVYIVGTSTTVEYKHGGSSIIRTFANPYFDSVGCTIDAAGELAITDQDPGEILVYSNGSSAGKMYTDSNCTYMWPAGYDNRGNLYVEGRDNTSGIVICELPKGTTTMRSVAFNELINFPGSIQWDGKFLTVADQEYQGRYNTALYQTTEASSGALTLVGTTELTAECNTYYTEVLEPYIVGDANAPVMHKQGKVVVGGNGQCSNVGVNFWRYPAGGLPKKFFGNYNVSGISVSFKR